MKAGKSATFKVTANGTAHRVANGEDGSGSFLRHAAELSTTLSDHFAADNGALFHVTHFKHPRNDEPDRTSP